MVTKRYTRRQLLQVGGAAAAAVTLAACAGPSTPQVVEKEVTKIVAGTPQVVKETVVAPSGPTNIRFSVWYGQGDIEVWDSINDLFEKTNGEIKVDFEPLAWSQYWQKLQVGLAAGDPPDVIGMGVGVVYDYIGRKQLVPLDPYLERDGVGRAQWFAGLLEEAVWPKPGGNLHALPYRFTGSAFFVNKTLFKEAGLEIPQKGWTWPNEYLKLAQALTDAGKGVWGSSVPPGQLAGPFLTTNGTSPLSADLRHSNLLDPKVEETYQFLADLICQHKVAPTPQEAQGLGDMFLSGKIAMHPDAQWDIAAYRKITDFEWDVVYNPMKEGLNKPGAYGGPDMISIPASSKHPEEAWEFTLFACGDAGAQKLMSATAVPTLIDQANSAEFVSEQEKLGPASCHIIIEQAADAVGWSFSPAWNEWNEALGQPLSEVYNCNMSAKDALQAAHPEVERIITEAFAALEG